MIGYYGLADETAATVDDDGWLHMGDVGEMDERGYLKITGRAKDMIIRGGLNLYPAEIEAALHAPRGTRRPRSSGSPTNMGRTGRSGLSAGRASHLG